MWWIILIRGKNWRSESIRLKKDRNMRNFEDLQIAVAGTGYVGLSIATLLSQHHKVTAVDVIPEKVEKINNRISPIQDDIYNAVKEISEMRGYSLVLDRSSDQGIIFGSPRIDISNEVLLRLGFAK